MSHDKNDPLFCGFAEANFFATWGNARLSRDLEQKSTEKYTVFIIDRLVPALRSRPATPTARHLSPPFATTTGFFRRSYRQLVVLALRVLASLS